MFSKKIIVSDVPDLLAILEGSFFQREGFGMDCVIDADEAFRLIESGSPAMVILDLSSLGESALECCRRVKSDPLLQVTPLICVLGHDQGDL